MSNLNKDLKILHFNDCYDVEERQIEPKGGASRFKTAICSNIDEKTIVLFSGDILGPSIMSTVTKGIHMAPVLNQCKVDCAVFGNHDFDFGMDNLSLFIKETKFPWLMSNVIDKETNEFLGNGKSFHLIEKNNIKIGLIGLVEEEWLATLALINLEDVIFKDYVLEGRRLAKFLKEKHDVNIVIALTHMRFPNDCRLANNVDEIDLILGGHDHDYEVKIVNDKYIIKSGTDFREFSVINLKINLNDKKISNLEIKKIEVNSSDFLEDEVLKSKFNKFKNIFEEKMENILGYFNCDLEGRFAKIRTEETNLGNFICDIINSTTKTDCVILNSGTLRSDVLHKKGPFKLRDLFKILPAPTTMVVLSITGKQIWLALENGVSQYPKYEGRFPQVSGIRFAFDSRKPPGQRIDPNFIKIKNEYLELYKTYKLTTKGYLFRGKDGYEVFKNVEVLVNEEDCQNLFVCLQNYFETVYKVLTESLISENTLTPRKTSILKYFNLNHINLDNLKKNFQDCDSESLKERFPFEPKIEERIINITNDKILDKLKQERDDFYKS